MARAHLEPAGPVVAGSEVKLVVDLLTTTWFTEAPDWPLFTVPDAIVNLPDEQAENLSGDIDGTRWFGVSRAYRIDSATCVADRGGSFSLPPVTIEWWNTTAGRKESVVLPAVHFSVAAVREKPLFELPIDDMRQGMPHRIVVIHAGQFVLGVLLISWRARAGAWVRDVTRTLGDARKRWLASDALAWRKLATTARRGEWRRTVPALYG